MRHRIVFCAFCLLLPACRPTSTQKDPVALTRGPEGSASEAGRPENRVTQMDYEGHIEKLEERLPHENFTVLLEAPFVVVGEEKPAVVKRRTENIVRWAVDKLKEAYFEKDPVAIIDIWLFKDKASYRKYSKVLFDHEPTTPYGYYLHAPRALVMNINTGGGTLVHEIVHPFIESNFPDCPAWFNEGLASLYEQSGEEAGQIAGYTNWRLAGLQETIRKGELSTFAELTSTTTHEFYDEDPGSYYAQARYLCYYLQEKKLLRKYYHRFAANAAKDPTGYKSLQEVLGVDDMTKFQKEWEGFVLKLRFQ